MIKTITLALIALLSAAESASASPTPEQMERADLFMQCVVYVSFASGDSSSGGPFIEEAERVAGKEYVTAHRTKFLEVAISEVIEGGYDRFNTAENNAAYFAKRTRECETKLEASKLTGGL